MPRSSHAALLTCNSALKAVILVRRTEETDPVLVVYALQIGGGLAVFLHLQQAVNHLQVVEKVVPLGAQLQVERVHLFIGRLQFADGALQPAGAQGILNVHARAPRRPSARPR